MSGIRGVRYIDENGNEVVTGGLKTAKTITERYGKDFYRNMGVKGGKISRGGGFTNNPELAREAGKKGVAARIRNLKLKKEKENENEKSDS